MHLDTYIQVLVRMPKGASIKYEFTVGNCNNNTIYCKRHTTLKVQGNVTQNYGNS